MLGTGFFNRNYSGIVVEPSLVGQKISISPTLALQVLHVINRLGIGGAEAMLCKLACQWARSELNSTIAVLSDLSSRHRDVLTKAGVNIVALGRISGLATLKALPHPDIVQGWLSQGNTVSYLLGRTLFPKAPVVWNIRNSISHPYSTTDRILVKLNSTISKSKRVRRIIVNSQAGIRDYSGVGYSSEKMILIGNGFDTETFRPQADLSKELRDELGIPHGSFVIGAIGRFHPMKDWSTFIRAANAATEISQNIKFVVLGPTIQQLQDLEPRLLKALYHKNCLHVLERGFESSSFYQVIDLLSLNSAWGEGFPNVLGEAMACARPCVATDVGDAAIVLGNKKLTISPGDVEGLVEKWHSIIKLPESERIELGVTNRNRVISEYSLRKTAAEYLNLYRELSQ